MLNNMETVTTINTYYQKIINLILKLYRKDLKNAKSGHCMKITGLGVKELEYLWEIIHAKFPQINTYIISEYNIGNERYISATKLVEHRNKNEAPLLILIPSNSRTAAEDSYGNATFKEISLEGIENRLKEDLIKKLPDSTAPIIKSEIIHYLSSSERSAVNIIKYLLALEEEGYSNESIGNNLYLLNLIPDSKLIEQPDKVRSRLNFNLESINLLGSFGKPLYDRIAELPMKPNTLQKELVSFLKAENQARNTEEICRLIHQKYNNSNFANWQIPDLNFTHIKLNTDEIRSNDFKVEEGRKVLRADKNKTSKVRIRFSTTPHPKDRSDLNYFKVILMAVDGGSGEEIKTLRKLKNTASNRPYREATIDLDSNNIEEGSYFFKVLAEDEHGNCLNPDDDFKEVKIQQAWEDAKQLDKNTLKGSFPFKLTCDSDDFDYIIDEEPTTDENRRKDKLNNVLQACFKFKIEKLKLDEESRTPQPSEGSNIWLTDRTKHTSTFHINYSEKHNYQINLSSKLTIIGYLLSPTCIL